MPTVARTGDEPHLAAGDHHQCVVVGGPWFEGQAARTPVTAHGVPDDGYVRGMTHDPDRIDPSKQSGRPLMLTGALIGLLLAVALMAVVFFLAR